MLHPAILAVFGFVYFIIALVGFFMLVGGIEDYIFYKKKSLENSNYKSKMTSAKRQSRTGLILLILGPFYLLFSRLRSIIRSLPKRPKSLATFWDAMKDIFFTF